MRAASAWSEAPDEATVMNAKVIAFTPRVFSSNRSFKYSGTERFRAVVKWHHENR